MDFPYQIKSVPWVHSNSKENLFTLELDKFVGLWYKPSSGLQDYIIKKYLLQNKEDGDIA